MRALALIVGIFTFAVPTAHSADELTVEKAKALISDAAGAPGDDVAALSTASMITPEMAIASLRGQSLVWWVLAEAPAFHPKGSTSFKFLTGSTQINPSYIADQMVGKKDKDGKYRKIATVIRTEDITDCTCKVDGDTATGAVSFKTEKLYEGKVEYTARKKDGKWRIEEFRLPDHKVTLALGDGGKWVKK